MPQDDKTGCGGVPESGIIATEGSSLWERTFSRGI